MKVAVTGAGGLLGGAVLRSLIAAGNEVIALSSSLDFNADLEGFRWDAKQDPMLTSHFLHGVEVLVHAGAYIPSHHYDFEEATKCIEVNAIGTLNLLRASELARVRRFIYVSGSNLLSPRSDLIREDDPVGCQYSPYYLGSKVLGEIYVRARMARGMDGLIVRPSSIYGPGMKSGVICSFVDRIRKGLPITLKDGGNFQADFVWRDDVASLLCDAVRSKQVGEVNLGSGQANNLCTLARLLVNIFEADENLIHYSQVRSESLARGFSAVDISRAREWFNFNPITLNNGLVRWFRESVI